MPDLCHKCGKPIVPHEEPRYTGREPEETWHYKCWKVGRPEPTNRSTLAADMAATLERGQRALDALKRRLR